MECTKSVSLMVFNLLQCNGYATVFAMCTRRHYEASEVKINFGVNELFKSRADIEISREPCRVLVRYAQGGT